MPASSMSIIASTARLSGANVFAGAIMSCPTGVAPGRSSATSFRRRSESVTIPKPSSSWTRTHETSAAAISRAASAALVSGAQTTTGRWTSEPRWAVRCSAWAWAT